MCRAEEGWMVERGERSLRAWRRVVREGVKYWKRSRSQCWCLPIGWQDERSSVFVCECRSSPKSAGACPSNPTKKQKGEGFNSSTSSAFNHLKCHWLRCKQYSSSSICHSLIRLSTLENSYRYYE